VTGGTLSGGGAMYQYLLETFSLWDLDPLHVTIEAICLAIIVYLWFQKSYKIRERPEALTERVRCHALQKSNWPNSYNNRRSTL